MTLATPSATDSVLTPAPELPLDIYVQVALAVPLHALFDYKVPNKFHGHAEDLRGFRVQVSFGPRKMTGIVVQQTTQAAYDTSKIKPIISILDTAPIISQSMQQLAQWCSRYYFYPMGETLATMLPVNLRQGKPLERYEYQRWQLTPLGQVTPIDEVKSSSDIQKQALKLIHEHGSLSLSMLNEFQIKSATLEALAKKNLIEKITDQSGKNALEQSHEQINKQAQSQNQKQTQTPSVISAMPLPLTAEQQEVCKAIAAETGVHLIFGVTGSGKTEVYMNLIQRRLELGEQVLVLVPEIGLTPQTLARFHKRFNVTISVLHSQQSDGDRAKEWCNAAAGQAQLIIGTRSAVFTPLPKLGLIIIDEEHDQSYKQQDGMRYSARDIAILRGQWQKCSVVLGSATPSLESLYNVQHKGFKIHYLNQRASGVTMPDLKLVDLRRETCQQGVSHTILQAMKKTLRQGQQVLVFLNRRGFAPAVICNDCGWTANCSECDAKLTLHRHSNKLKCHHCEHTRPVPFQCPMCESVHLNPHGKGTERVEETLQEYFKEPVVRVDRDTMTTQTKFNACLKRIHTGEPMILLGTQMLSKGHNFLGVHLVVILDIDNGLFSSDFRAEEKTSQLLSQVAGRAGRGTVQGQVLVQTFQPDHPLFQHWVAGNYQDTSRYLLNQRQETGLPPYSYHILLRAESSQPQQAREFLLEARDLFMQALQQHEDIGFEDVMILGPVNASMERKAGVSRSHLLIQGFERLKLHRLVASVFHLILQMPSGKKARWGFEVDPQDF